MSIAELPILFTAPMVRAILDGRKTQTRRIMKPQPAGDIRSHTLPNAQAHAWISSLRHKYGQTTVHTCPHGQKLDRLWVRETWATVNGECGPGFAYKADGAFMQPEYDGPNFGAGPSFNYDKYPGEYTMWYSDLLEGVPGHKWRPSIHMPRWASRITLEILNVRVQRLRDISEADAMAEGAPRCVMDDEGKFYESEKGTYRCGFAGLWDHINGAGSWDACPFVWAIAFRRIEKENGK